MTLSEYVRKANFPDKAGRIALAQHRLSGGPPYSAVINTLVHAQ